MRSKSLHVGIVEISLPYSKKSHLLERSNGKLFQNKMISETHGWHPILCSICSISWFEIKCYLGTAYEAHTDRHKNCSKNNYIELFEFFIFALIMFVIAFIFLFQMMSSWQYLPILLLFWLWIFDYFLDQIVYFDPTPHSLIKNEIWVVKNDWPFMLNLLLTLTL